MFFAIDGAGGRALHMFPTRSGRPRRTPEQAADAT
jgi:hypothetical protein